MNILIFSKAILPVVAYGGTERVVWDLGEALEEFGHHVWWLSPRESKFRKGTHIPYNPKKDLNSQIPPQIDIVHLHCETQEKLNFPYVITIHGKTPPRKTFDRNSIFISNDQAQRCGSTIFVHNGLNWSNYPKPDLSNNRDRFHFLGKAAWKVKNVKGAIQIAQKAKERIDILGGTRLNFKMGFRLTLTPKARFHGIIGGEKKFSVLNQSKGLIFPVRWHEPFGLAVIESLWFGAPVFGTPYGSLPELITDEIGYLSKHSSDLVNAIQDSERYCRKRCHSYAGDSFNNLTMAHKYLELYEKVASGKTLNPTNPICTQPGQSLLPFE
ncbi:glycosyltransferase [Cellvibrio sp. PSBB006]|uniref:glycosyltransferase n=1 Tax=Cellvibrio sp. PSBB006 TaxID=1987723 RepID=UPI000B3B63EA|nr:glycosyltransferase [Cellvibrio sp. PSBB006]ARU27264.1 hypothetical protein CBR65_07330 [Cellvibrio sp. PSBB006]